MEKSSRSKPLLYLFIRMLTLGLRFVFIALFFRYSEPLYGEFSLLATTVMLGVYILGLDFYTYANREILNPRTNVSHVFLHQLTFYLILYLPVLPLFYLAFAFGFLDKSYVIWFYILLVTEHLSFELHRLLFVLKRPLAANINLFFRNGFWVLPLIYMFYEQKEVSIRHIVLFWIIGDILSLMPGIVLMKKNDLEKIFRFRPDYAWIKKGLYISIPFFLSTLSFKIIEFSDRYFIDYFYDKATVGIYSFFGNISYLVNTVVYTVVISLLFPGLVESILARDKRQFEMKFSEFKRKITVWTIVTSAGVSALMPLILLLLDKQTHLIHYEVFVILVTANGLLNFSMIYHFALYGFKKDKALFVSVFTAMIINVLLNFVAIPVWGMKGAALTTLLAMFVVFTYKLRAYKSVEKQALFDEN
jgi:O-antigen/teichoic acid export membrane protein